MNKGVLRNRSKEVTGLAGGSNSHELIVMLFDGALAHLEQAGQWVRRGDVQRKAIALDKALAIIGGLQASLDCDNGGELADNLDALYDYMQRRLSRAIAEDDFKGVEEVADLVSTLKQGWDAIGEVAHTP